MKSALVLALGTCLIISCSEKVMKSPGIDAHVAVSVAEEVPAGIDVPINVHVEGELVSDSIRMYVQNEYVHSLYPEQEVQDLSYNYAFYDTGIVTHVKAEAYLPGNGVVLDEVLTRAREVYVTLQLPDTLDRTAVLEARISPARLFSNLRLSTDGLDTTIALPATQEYIARVTHTFPAAGYAYVEARGELNMGALVIDFQRVYVR
ncbi:MAG: hypothetical protein V1725_08265 [archaeon]